VLIIDDILFAPAHSLFWIFREIHKAAKEELGNEAESITDQLRNLYMQLETSRISEQQFDDQEKLLLDRLDSLEADPESSDDGESEETTVGGHTESHVERHVRDT
jgi:hypothetical protein